MSNPKLLEREFDSSEYEDLEVVLAARRVWFTGLCEEYDFPVDHAVAMSDSGLPVPVMPLLLYQAGKLLRQKTCSVAL